MKSKAESDSGVMLSGSNIFSQTLIANRIVADSGSGLNPYELRNDSLTGQKKERVRYENGITLPASARALTLDAESRAGHSRTLARNIAARSGHKRPAGADAHPIVAAGRLHPEAIQARGFLINWGIGINDADNGVYLPRNRATPMSGTPDATTHQNMHTNVYYFEVTRRLAIVAGEETKAGRAMLRSIGGELISGTFPIV